MSNLNVFSYSGQNVTTSAYVTLINEIPLGVSHIQMCDTSGELLRVAVGVTGQEVDMFTTPVSGCIIIPCYLLQGQRISVKSITNTASNGYNTIAFLLN